jgi:hypothetical protein
MINPHEALLSSRSHGRTRLGKEAVCYTLAPGLPSYFDSNATLNNDSASQQIPRRPSDVGNPESQSRHDVDHQGNVRPAPDTSAASAQTNDAEARISSVTAEHVRKAIVASAYSGLQIVPDAFLQPRPFLLAHKAEDLLKHLMKRCIANSHVSVQFGYTDYTIVKDGTPVRYYGRGPIWQNNSCYWDSIIVSCLLLNAGFTYLDQGTSPGEWVKSLTTIQRAFLDVLRMDWDSFDTKTSIAQRDMFLNLYHRESKDGSSAPKPSTKGTFDSPVSRWNDVAVPFKQFSFQAHQRRQPCSCQNRRAPENAASEVRYISPPYQVADAKGVTMADLLQRWSRFVLPHCSKGAKEITNIINGNLSLRIVIQATSGVKLLDHTSQNISFSYNRIEPDSGREISDRITYRWLGGVYCSKNHFRVYWNDSAPEAKTVTGLRVYDGMEAVGAIIGDVPPASPSEPIPDSWIRLVPPLLFYEQVVYPSTSGLESSTVCHH